RAPRQQTFEHQMVSVSTLLRSEDQSYEPPAHLSPEAIYMKQWAASLIRQVRDRLQMRCLAEGRPLWYDLFLVVHWADDPARQPTQEALAHRFGLTRDQVRYALEQTAEWFATLLRAELRDQVATEEDIDAEIRELMELLGNDCAPQPPRCPGRLD